MSYAVRIGTTEAIWIDRAEPPDGFVRFDGQIADDLIWGDDVQTLRARNAQELLAKAKSERLATIRAEAETIITAKWPLWAQSNCALGVYPEASANACRVDIAAVVQACNAAEDAVDAASSVADVEAVTATWPAL